MHAGSSRIDFSKAKILTQSNWTSIRWNSNRQSENLNERERKREMLLSLFDESPK